MTKRSRSASACAPSGSMGVMAIGPPVHAGNISSALQHNQLLLRSSPPDVELSNIFDLLLADYFCHGSFPLSPE